MFSGRTAILRLLEVAKLAPTKQLQRHALLLAISIIKSETLDFELYDTVLAHLTTLAAVGDVVTDEGIQVEAPANDLSDEVMDVDGMGVSVETGLEAQGQRDDDWFQRTAEKARREDEKLEAEMRNYSINLIKESIRVSDRCFSFSD
jgi:hypothetical protein